MPTETVVMGESGRIVLPAAIRKEFGLKPGERLTVVSSGGEIRIMSRRMALDRLRAEIARHVPPGVSLADELIRERREEAQREEEEYQQWKAERAAADRQVVETSRG